MTTDQVVVYGGNDGVAETYNTVAVDRGNGPGQEQLVQQVGYSTTATGSLVLNGDVVQIDTAGMAGVTVQLSGTYSSGGSAVVFEASFDGVTWLTADALVLAPARFTPGVGVVDDSSYAAFIATKGAVLIRVTLQTDLLSGLLGVLLAAQPNDPMSTYAYVMNTVSVNIAEVDTIIPVSLVTVTLGAATALAAVDDAVQSTLTNGLMVQVTGDLDGTLVAELSLDGSTFVPVATAWLLDIETGVAGALDSAGVWLVNIAGPMGVFRVRCSAYTSGTATVTLSASLV